jgi:hypothetical protein
MTHFTEPNLNRSQRAGWLIVLILALLMILNSLFFGLLGVMPEIFEFDTGVSWAQFSANYPTVAAHLDLAERLNGSGYMAAALFSAVLAFVGLRQGVRWAWNALWIYPGVLLLGATWFFTHNQVGIGGFYVAAASIAVLGLLLASRTGRTADRAG